MIIAGTWPAGTPPENTHFKAQLHHDQRLCGLWSTLNSTTATEILAHAGADWLLLDMEHSPADVASILAQLRAATGSPTSIIVRPPSDDAVTLKRLLDAGASNLLVPFVNNAEQARQIARAMRYPPEGSRGVAASNRGARYGLEPSYLHTANESVCTIVQIETVEAVHNAGQIAAATGVDAIFVGPSYLAASLGHIGNVDHADVQVAMRSVLHQAERAGKPVGTFASSPADAREKFEQGFRFVAVVTDIRLLLKGAQAALLTARGR